MINAGIRKIAVLTVGRSDFGRYMPVLKALRQYPSIKIELLVSGAHLASGFGDTWQEIKDNGFDWDSGLEMTLSSDSPAALGKSLGVGIISLAQNFSRTKPDLLFLLGDRYEMLSGACAALGFNIPIVHLHGGNLTEGAIDDSIRHALTKLSHIHLTSCTEHSRRIMQMGEEDWRVITVGAPILDGIHELASVTENALSKIFSLDFSKDTLLFTFHPTTLDAGGLAWQIDELLAAIADIEIQVVMTYPNADPGHQVIIDKLTTFSKLHPKRVRLQPNLGTQTFLSLMRHCRAIVGNSSAGIVESASFKLPSVNIGLRQNGKLRAKNVIDVGNSCKEIKGGLNTAISKSFRDNLSDLTNPYGDGKSGPRIAKILAEIELNPCLIRKRFIDRKWK
jgi:UDP-hydrolysing UDP-N-acetyl-D-glucosamine 2-epimerase